MLVEVAEVGQSEIGGVFADDFIEFGCVEDFGKRELGEVRVDGAELFEDAADWVFGNIGEGWPGE